MFGRKDYEIDRQHDAHMARIAITCGGAGFIWGLIATGSVVTGIGLGVLLAGVGTIVYYVVTVGTAKLVAHSVFPDTRGQAGVGYSHIDALEAKGDIAGALAAWEAVIAADPNAVAARMHAADLYAKKSDDQRRAASLFKEIQTHTKASAEVQRYASQRLIDLYFGTLNDEGRARVEMRRLVERWPTTTEAKFAREALKRLKHERHE
jgi:hypothetical protein